MIETKQDDFKGESVTKEPSTQPEVTTEDGAGTHSGFILRHFEMSSYDANRCYRS
jgi:hypothetical protein